MESNPRPPRFEEVYPRYEFAPLVRLALVSAAWLKARRARQPQRDRTVSAEPRGDLLPGRPKGPSLRVGC